MHDPLLYIFGAFGALIYAFPMYLASLSAVPPSRFALAVLLFSVAVGCVFGPVFVPPLGHWKPFLVTPEPYPLAIGIGLLSNPLVPVFLRKVLGWADAYQIGGSK